MEEDLLVGDNKYRVEGHGLQEAVKGLRFLRFPPVLQLHLKRYEYDMEQDRMAKVGDRLEFPKVLDVTPYSSSSSSSKKSSRKGKGQEEGDEYLLHAVVIHVGDGEGGHYYAYIDPHCSGDWHRFDDGIVTRVSEKIVMQDGFGGSKGFLFLPFMGKKASTCAYMLQYVQKSKLEEVLRGGGGSQSVCDWEGLPEQ